MPPCVVKLLLDTNRPPFYTNLDTIQGRVILHLYGLLDVENIQVKLEGFAKTEIEVRKNTIQNGNLRSRKVTKSEEHTLVYQCKTVFPPPNVREVSQPNARFTLSPGIYEYDFYFQIPMNNQCGSSWQNKFAHSTSPLPPSITGDGFCVEYFVKVTVRRPSLIKLNIRETRQLLLKPFDPIDEIMAFSQPFSLSEQERFTEMLPKKIPKLQEPTDEPRKTVSSKISTFFKSLKEEPPKGLTVPFSFEVRFDGPYMIPNQPLNYKLLITSRKGPRRYKDDYGQSSGLGQFVIRSLEIYLIRFGSFTAESHTKSFKKTYTLFKNSELDYRIDLADLVLNPSARNAENANPYELEIKPQLYETAKLPNNLKPTFRICNINMEYKLQIKVRFAETAQTWAPKKMVLSTPVKVLCGVPPPEEYIQHTQVPPHIASEFLSRYPSEMRAPNLGVAFDLGINSTAALEELSSNTQEEPPRYERYERR